MASKYANGCPDKSANGLFKLCKKTGPISTIPKTPGLVVWRSGHIGISMDGEYAIEARGFNYGVVKTKIKNRGWGKWGMLPSSLIDYVEEQTPSAPESTKYQYVEDELKARGLEVDAAAIEAAVREMNLLDSWEAGFDYEPDDSIDDEYDDGEVAEHAEAE